MAGQGRSTYSFETALHFIVSLDPTTGYQLPLRRAASASALGDNCRTFTLMLLDPSPLQSPTQNTASQYTPYPVFRQNQASQGIQIDSCNGYQKPQRRAFASALDNNCCTYMSMLSDPSPPQSPTQNTGNQYTPTPVFRQNQSSQVIDSCNGYQLPQRRGSASASVLDYNCRFFTSMLLDPSPPQSPTQNAANRYNPKQNQASQGILIDATNSYNLPQGGACASNSALNYDDRSFTSMLLEPSPPQSPTQITPQTRCLG